MKIIKILVLVLTISSVYAGNIADLSTREDGYIAIGAGSQKLNLKFNSTFGYLESRVINTNPNNPTSKGEKDLQFDSTGIILHGGKFITPDMRIGVQYLAGGSSDFKTSLLGLYGDYLFNYGLYIGVGLNYMTLDYSKEEDVELATGFVASYRTGMLFQISDNIGLDINYQFANKLLPAKHKGSNTISSETGVGDYENWGFINISLSYHF
jgi:hypothetical protein